MPLQLTQFVPHCGIIQWALSLILIVLNPQIVDYETNTEYVHLQHLRTFHILTVHTCMHVKDLHLCFKNQYEKYVVPTVLTAVEVNT